MPHQPWTPEEDELIRTHYPDPVQRKKLAALLPHRKPKSLVRRASQLRLVRSGTPWTEQENEILRLWYNSENLNRTQRRLPHRSMAAIIRQARLLGMLRGTPKGCISFNAAVKLGGYHPDATRRILQWAEVPISRRLSMKKNAQYRWGHVDRFLALDAFERWQNSEFLGAAAEARGLTRDELRAILVAYGLKSPGPKVRWRIETKHIDAALAARKKAA